MTPESILFRVEGGGGGVEDDWASIGVEEKVVQRIDRKNSTGDGVVVGDEGLGGSDKDVAGLPKGNGGFCTKATC